MSNDQLHRKCDKPLGLPELIAIAVGGMVGGGIFTVLGISVSMIGVYTPVAIFLGGLIAALAAYSYVKLGVYYKDDGATYSFFKKTFPDSSFAASLIGWWVVFGYISTLALYSYTFASYAISGFSFSDNEWLRKLVAGGIILIFVLVNIWSVKGMGKIEDLLVYTKLVILAIISFVLIDNSQTSLPVLWKEQSETGLFSILIVASITFVAYEGFQLVIHAIKEMETPEKNIPRAIYSAIFLTLFIYIAISLGAILAIPFEQIIENQEYALASGTHGLLGNWGTDLVILGALLATSSAISGTLFGASRLMTVIAKDGFMPLFITKQKSGIPVNAIIIMGVSAFVLILAGSLKLILEFGSVTFLLVSLLMAYANLKIYKKTNSSRIISILALVGLSFGTLLILYYEAYAQMEQLVFIVVIYLILTLAAYLYTNNRVPRNE